jgi:hypothetical protein
LFNLFTLVISSLSLFVFLKYFLIVELRVDENYYKIIYNESKKINCAVILHEEFTDGFRYPIEYKCFCKVNKYFIYLNHFERLLNAGWVGKDYATNLVCFRWDYSGLKSFLQDLNYKNTDIPVDIIMPYSSDRIGSIKKNNDNKPVANIQSDYDFVSLLESDLDKMCKGEMDKTGAILHGNPGNGKTFFIKYIASKYDLPVKVVSFNPDWTNHDILNLFSQVSSKCIVLFEDFDNYFNGRNCLIKSENIKFTFDTILNCFDGVYNNYKHVVFFMTVNDIDKVDEAIKNRPSRFRYVAEFKNPDFNTRLKILENKTLAEDTDGLNLDQVFFEKHKNHISA